MPTTRDRYIVGKLGSYDTSTVTRIDLYLRHLHPQLTMGTDRRRASARHDVDLLLDARSRLTQR